MWEVKTTNAFDAWFATLDEDGQAELIAKVNLLTILGPRLGRPHADALFDAHLARLKAKRKGNEN